MYFKHLLVVIPLIVMGCQQDSSRVDSPDRDQEEEEIASSLPFKEVDLVDLASFKDPTSNWSIAGLASSNIIEDKNLTSEAGTGILVNRPTEEAKGNLFTNWEHGDLELQLSFMMPKGSNSGIYLQGRYEIQLFDSWKKATLNYADCGAIYQRYDEQTQKGYEGHAPPKNAAKAPGLWQDLYISFIAPKFDSNGEKIANATFKKVVLNGVLLHENVEVFGPTRAATAMDEVPKAPLMIQGDHGPIAFKNIRFKRFETRQLVVGDLSYQYYAFDEAISKLPNFSDLEVTSSGKMDSFDILKPATQKDWYAVQFQGKLKVEFPGDYLFHLFSDDGTRLSINGQTVVTNDFNHGMNDPKRGLITLPSGEHDLMVDYYNNDGGKGLALMYEGPQMRYQALNTLPYPNQTTKKKVNPLVINIQERPELLRGFLNYGDEKRTHIISVGQPSGLHYAIDLNNGALLKFWRGAFADASQMWVGRGHTQLISPLELAVEGADYPIVTNSANSNIQLDRYELDEQGFPAFYYHAGDITLVEKITGDADQDELIRSIQWETGTPNGYQTILASSDNITQLENGYYYVGGHFYIKIIEGTNGISIQEQAGQNTLVFNFSESEKELAYSLLW